MRYAITEYRTTYAPADDDGNFEKLESVDVSVDVTPDEFDLDEGKNHVQLAIDYLKRTDAVEASVYPLENANARTWLSGSYERPYTAEREEYSWHFDCFTDDEVREIVIAVIGPYSR